MADTRTTRDGLSRLRVWTLAFLALVATLVVAPAARAHGTRSVSVDVTEFASGRAVVHLRSSEPGDLAQVHAVFGAPCTEAPAEEEGDTVTMVACPGSLTGQHVTVLGLGPIVSEAILIVSLQDGEHLSRVLTASEPSFTLPAAQSGLAIARSYVRLGVVHILTGYDHLLFLLALVLLLRRPRAVLVAETAFTVSHSVSFSATALGLVHLSAAAAEAAIALSLVLVALDIGHAPEAPGPARDARERDGAFMALVFGLVHGLGFAGGLRDIGLPDVHVSLALAGFAAGVELGQVTFLVVALLALQLARKRLAPARIEAGTRWGYMLIGSIASYWLIERTLVLIASHV